jgi:N utilization substance protein B
LGCTLLQSTFILKMSRHDARVLALQVLYEADTAQREAGVILSRHFQEGELAEGLRSYSSQLVSGVVSQQAGLDKLISELAPDFPVGQLAAIDRNILRIALWEMRYGDVPMKAAINEAVDLAKDFGSDTSARFINGVLGAAATL